MVALSLAGCTSSGPGKSSASVSTPPPSTPPPTTSAAPTPAPSSSAPLSPFEQDPAVKAMRAWAARAGRTVNTGHYTDATLRTLMTPALAATMKNVLGDDVGLYYPGPIPVTPLSVRVVNSTDRQLRLCVIGAGYAEKPTTHRPAAALKVLPINAAAVLSAGRWRLSLFDTATNFSCAGVKIPRPSWS